MNLDRQLKTEHLLLEDRMCRTCGEEKNLLSDFYLSRSKNPDLPSSYSYECKGCARVRITGIYSSKEVFGTCPVCKTHDIKLVTDLCRSCNRALKIFKYDLDMVERAMLYLEQK